MRTNQFKCVVESHANIIYQPNGPDPKGVATLTEYKKDLQQIADEKRKPVVFLFHDGSRWEFQPK